MPRHYLAGSNYTPEQIQLMLEVYDELVKRYGLDEFGQRNLAGVLLLKVGAGFTDKATLLQLASEGLARP